MSGGIREKTADLQLKVGEDGRAKVYDADGWVFRIQCRTCTEAAGDTSPAAMKWRVESGSSTEALAYWREHVATHHREEWKP